MPQSSNQTVQDLDSLLAQKRAEAASPIPALQGDPSQMLVQPVSTAVTTVEPVTPIEILRQKVSETASRPARELQRPLREFLGRQELPRLENTFLDPRNLGPMFRPYGFLVQGPTDDKTYADIYDAIAQGTALGSVVLPDDTALGTMDVMANNPFPALKLAAAFGAAAVEGFVGDKGVLRFVGIVKGLAKARNLPNLLKSADAALELFGQGEDLSKFRQAMGGAALGATSEVILQTAGLQDPLQILEASAAVSVLGGTMGATVASLSEAQRLTHSLPRAAQGFMEGFGKRAESEIVAAAVAGEPAEMIATRVTATVAQDQAAFATRAFSPEESASFAPSIAYLERLDDAAEALSSARQLGREGHLFGKPRVSEAVAKLEDPRMEAMFAQGASETFRQRLTRGFTKAAENFRESFVYEAKLRQFPSLSGLQEDGYSLADDLRLVKARTQRASRLADKDLSTIIGPLRAFDKLGRRADFGRAWAGFERLIVLRDLSESGGKGLQLPDGFTLKGIRSELQRLEGQINPEIRQAAENHRQVVGEMRNELIRRGKLPANAGFENYFPHRIINDLAEEHAVITGRPVEELRELYPTSGVLNSGRIREAPRDYTIKREGSKRAISTDYLEVMHAALTRFQLDNTIDDFLQEIADSPLSMTRANLTTDELNQMIRSPDNAFNRDGTRFKLFQPRGVAHNRFRAAAEENARAIRETALIDNGVDLAQLPGTREILEGELPREMVLPAALADRLEQFYQPDPLRDAAGFGFDSIRRATAWWKRNTIWWGLNRFFMFQIVGDSINLAASNPRAFLQIRNGRLDSPAARALQEQFRAYGTPMLSPQQTITTLTGAAIFNATFNEVLASEDQSMLDRVANIMIGAGLGYGIGTRMMAGTRRAYSNMYDVSEDLGVINSGFTFSEENAANRVLGEAANFRIGERTPHWRRSVDTIATATFGKPFGNPYSFIEAPAHTIEVIQRERENWLRMAHFFQQIGDGVDNRIAAKRAREDLVDYARFTDYENRIVRGFALPFYAFARQNIPRWVRRGANIGRAVVGRADPAVGGTIGAVATASIAGFDIAAQKWNETFFPDVERSLDKFQKERFHIIVGNPDSGEPYRDKEGRVLVVGWEQPYEQALEFFGIARPGMVWSELFGIGGEHEELSLVERGRRTARDAARMQAGPSKIALELLSPFLKEPMQLINNRDYHWNAPIVPQHYFATGEHKAAYLKHVAETAFRQLRETKALQRQVAGGRFNPLTSAFGLGVPGSFVDLDRETDGVVHEFMDKAEELVLRQDNRWRKVVDDIFYERPIFRSVPEGEPQKAWDEINAIPNLTPNDRAQAWRYYMDRGGRGSITRRYSRMSIEEKLKLAEVMDPWAYSMLQLKVNGGMLSEFVAPSAGGPSVTGN